MEPSIAQLEGQRSTLGDSVVEAAGAVAGEARSPGVAGTSTSATGEWRVVTGLFFNVAGWTTLAEGMDPEAWKDISTLETSPLSTLAQSSPA